MGRPFKKEQPRNIRLSLKLTEAEADEINMCAKKYNISRTDAIVNAVKNMLKN
jgi:uncharacterized protein (DUF1778 family)